MKCAAHAHGLVAQSFLLSFFQCVSPSVYYLSCCRLGCDAIHFDRTLSAFRRNIYPFLFLNEVTATLMMEAVWFSGIW
jgi:hypothetical protein